MKSLSLNDPSAERAYLFVELKGKKLNGRIGKDANHLGAVSSVQGEKVFVLHDSSQSAENTL